MGLFGRFKKEMKPRASSYTPIHERYPLSDGEQLIESFAPSWIESFPDFPYQVVGQPAIRTTLVSRMRDVFAVAADDAPRVDEIFSLASSLLDDAHNLAKFPYFTLVPPSHDNMADIMAMPICWIRCIPFTEKTKRVSKHPFKLEYDTGRMRCEGQPDASVKMFVDLLPDGSVGRIETQLALFDSGASFAHCWVITSKLVEGSIVVSRIQESKVDGGMPTLYAIGR